MNQTKKSVLLLGGGASMLCSAVGAVLYSTAYSAFYDKAIHHYDPSPTVTAFAVLFALSVLISIVTAVFFRKLPPIQNTAPNQIESFILWFAAFMFFFFGVLSLTSQSSVPTDTVVESAAAFSLLGKYCSTAAAPLAILSALSLAFSVSGRLHGTAVHRAASLIPILWGSCMLLKYYFDLRHAPLNDPEVILTSVCTAAMTLLFISEARLALGIGTPAISLFCNLTCLCLTGFVSAARIFLGITAGLTTPPLMENIIFFSTAAIALVRLVSFPEKLSSATPALMSADGDVPTDAESSSDGTDA